MAAREFHCKITNLGSAPIEWVKDELSHGEWGEQLPSQATLIIQPGETASYDAESGGDIPIIGSIATGTEGWVLYRTRTGTGAIEYILVQHNVPYFQVDGHETRCVIQVHRYDPTADTGPSQFEDRKEEPPETKIVSAAINLAGGGFGPPLKAENVPATVLIGPISLIGLVPDVHVSFWVAGNTFPPDMKLPASTPQVFNPTFVASRNSSPHIWAGAWEGSRMQAEISRKSDCTLAVKLHDKQTGDRFEGTAQIDRLMVGALHPDIGAIRDAISEIDKVAVRMDRIGMEGPESIRYLEEEQKGIIKLHPDLKGMELGSGFVQKPLGGDFLALSNGSCLEILSMSQDGRKLGHALRYTSQVLGGIPVKAPGAFQEHLHVMARLR